MEVTRLGVDMWATPLYEIERGVLNVTQGRKAKPVREYLSAQGRFRDLKPEQLDKIRADTDASRRSLFDHHRKHLFL